MPVDESIEIRRLEGADLRANLDGLADVLSDCVAGGASVGYMASFTNADARREYQRWAEEADLGRRLILGAFDRDDGPLVGTVQVILTLPPNKPHRGEIAKMLVRRSARRRGVGQRLLEAAERAARDEGKTLLVLDAVTDGDAARLYARIGWQTVGVVPDFALYPDGRFCDTTYFYKRLT
ncbi:MAG: GNAT family N-acetyltransferase [Candidatus Limnocylindrales bacterium]